MATKRLNTATRQEQIIDAARKLITRKGSEHVTVRNIAKEVRISEAAIYRHFKNKHEIMAFLADRITDSLLYDIESIKQPSSLAGIEQILQRHFSNIEQRKGMSFLVIAEILSLGDKSLNRKTHENIVKYILRLEALFSEALNRGAIRSDTDLHAVATLLFSMIQGVVNLWALNNYGFDLVRSYTSLWNVLKTALEPS